MKANWKRYKELELIPDSMWESALREAKRNRLSSHSWLNKLWNAIANLFTKESEPHIRERCDRDGGIWWEVYDPLTGRSSCFSSRAEVLAWLDQRYYRELR